MMGGMNLQDPTYNVAHEADIDTSRSGGTGPGGGSDGSDLNDPPNDFERLARMIDRINKSLGSLVNLELGIIDPKLQAQFVEVWPQAEDNMTEVINRLQEEAIRVESANDKRSTLRLQLEIAGMTGQMLRMKEMSLYSYLDPIDEIVAEPPPTESFQSPTPKKNWRQKIAKRLRPLAKPAFMVMNSIFGSLLKVFPQLEVVKELKEHVEASYEVSGLPEEGRE